MFVDTQDSPSDLSSAHDTSRRLHSDHWSPRVTHHRSSRQDSSLKQHYRHGSIRRPTWDLKGKESNMDKTRGYQKRVKSVVHRNAALKGSLAESQTKAAEVEKQLSQIREYEEELQSLSGVRDELEKVSSERNTLQKELSNLEGKYKVMKTLRDSQETELQTLKMKLSVQESTLARVQATLRDTEEEVRCLKETVAQQNDDLHAGEMERRRLHNTIQELKVSHKESGKSWRTRLQHTTTFKLTQVNTGKTTDTQKNYNFSFGPKASQQELTCLMSLLVQSVLDGYNVCCFAHGQTGSGQMYHGGRELDIEGINAGRDVKCKSKLEGNWDLLYTGKASKRPEHEIRKSANNEVLGLIALANQNRSTAQTAQNDRSSRSHSVFQLDIEGINAGRDVKCNHSAWWSQGEHFREDSDGGDLSEVESDSNRSLVNENMASSSDSESESVPKKRSRLSLDTVDPDVLFTADVGLSGVQTFRGAMEDTLRT
ncbi:kinesin-like protein KIFC1 [Echeneis naucrates]|uniref:kinesin-like protein KIFC1 n=1 Tax=Echeneis naucrates TaxID=173247 RepID=UPI001113751F|nr:kinesin-like protein KIFC1 [Echeneis naucrates]